MSSYPPSYEYVSLDLFATDVSENQRAEKEAKSGNREITIERTEGDRNALVS